MEKVCYVLWRDAASNAGEDPSAAVAQWAVSDVVPALADAPEVHRARVLVEAPEGAAMRVGARGPMLLCSLVSVWLDVYQDREGVDALLASGPVADRHAYLVTESVPHEDPTVVRSPGERWPGLTLATVFDKKPGVSEVEFFHVWHDLHRRTTIDLHPVYFYSRNEVVRSLTPDAPPLRGIVYEPTQTAEEMLDPHRFYGSHGDDVALKANIDRVVTETSAFIDYPTMEVAAMHTYEVGPG